MNVFEIRRLVNVPNADPARIVSICQEALFSRTDTVDEHAWILYFLAEASYAVDPRQAATCANMAARASSLAIHCGQYLLAVKAGCLRIALLVETKAVRTSSLLSDLDEIRELLKNEWHQHLEPRDLTEAANELDRLQFTFVRLAQNAR